MTDLANNALVESLLDWWELAGIDVDPRPATRKTVANPGVGPQNSTEVTGRGEQLGAQRAPAKRAASRAEVDDTWDDAPSPGEKPSGPIAKPRQAGAISESASDAISAAAAIAKTCRTLAQLEAAIAGFDGIALKATAKQAVFADGVVGSKVMVIGEAPGREEDDIGRPFVGPSGLLLDKMLASIGLSRKTNVYISNVLNWRPPGNRPPTQTEVLTSMPFIERHIALASPKILILAGGVSAKAILRTEDGIMRMRGRKGKYVPDQRFGLDAPDLPAFPIFHPSYLLRRPQEKRLAWADLLVIEKAIAAL